MLPKNFKQQMKKEKNVNDKFCLIFIVVLVSLFFVFLLQFFLYWILVKPSNPLNVPLFFRDFDDAFMDFYNVNYFVHSNNPYMNEGSSYPPLSLLIAKLFSLFPGYRNGTIGFNIGKLFCILSFFLISFVSMYLLLKTYLRRKGLEKKNIRLIAFVLLFSAPMLFLIERGNYIFITFIFCAIFFVLKDCKNKFVVELSYVCLALAVATKLYPAIFSLILLRKRKIWEVFRIVLYSIVFLTLPFLFFEGGFHNVKVFVENILDFSKASTYLVLEDGKYLISNSNNFSVMNTLTVSLYLIKQFNFLNLPRYVSIAGNILTIVFGILIVFSTFFSNKSWKMIASCSLGTVILLNPSFMYTAIFLFIPCVCFLVDKTKTKRDCFYLLLFLIIFSPVQFGFLIQPLESGLAYGITTANYIQMLSLLIFVIILTISSINNLIKNKSFN